MSELRLLPILISICGIYVFKSSTAQAHALKANSNPIEIQAVKAAKKAVHFESPVPQTLDFQRAFTLQPPDVSPSSFDCDFFSSPANDYKIRVGLSPPVRI